MEAQMTEKQDWYEVEGPSGNEWIPADLVTLADNELDPCKPIVTQGANGSYVSIDYGREPRPVPAALADYVAQPTYWSLARVKGYGVRSSEPGYSDCTPWTVYTNLKAAQAAYDEECRENGPYDDRDEGF